MSVMAETIRPLGEADNDLASAARLLAVKAGTFQSVVESVPLG
jgi:hypothetical protein